MKRMLIISILILGLVATYSSGTSLNDFAQMGHGMMRDKAGEVEHGNMMGDMMGITQDMSGMMRDMSEMMGDMSKMSKDISRDRMHKMSNMMREMCAEMNRMSDMMDKGMATDEQMKDMHNRMMEIQKQMSDMKK